jgi:hypothetical protein
MNDELRIARNRHLFARFHAQYVFIDFWNFADDDTTVVIRSVNSKGPSWIEKYRLDSGELVAEGSGSTDVPEWAKPYSVEAQPGN